MRSTPKSIHYFLLESELQQRTTTGLKNSNEQQQDSKTENRTIFYFLLESERTKKYPPRQNREGIFLDNG
jgi:hypothetical protein